MKKLGLDCNSKSKSLMKDGVILFSFFYYFIGQISVIAYLISLLKTRWILPKVTESELKF